LLEILWPSGQVDQYTGLAGNRILKIEEGNGKGMAGMGPNPSIAARTTEIYRERRASR